MDNREPTPEVIGAALKRAQQLVKEGMHINEALAAATTSAQCQGYMGFKVFALTRGTVKGVIGPKVYEDFCTKADVKAQVEALESAYLVVMS